MDRRLTVDPNRSAIGKKLTVDPTRAAVAVVTIRRFWDQPSEATVPVDMLSDLRMVRSRTMNERPWFGPPMLSALVPCDAIANVDQIHLGLHGSCPHTIRVLIAGVDNPRSIYRALRESVRQQAAGGDAYRRQQAETLLLSAGYVQQPNGAWKPQR